MYAPFTCRHFDDFARAYLAHARGKQRADANIDSISAKTTAITIRTLIFIGSPSQLHRAFLAPTAQIVLAAVG